MSHPDDPTTPDDPFGDLGAPVRSVASSLAAPTGHQAEARRQRRRTRSVAAASAVLVAVLLGGVALANRPGTREVTAAGVPGDGSSQTGVPGSGVGTVPGTVVDPNVVPTCSGELVMSSGAGTCLEPTSVPPVTDETTVPPDPTTTVPATTSTTAPVPGATRYEGTYEGIGHFSISGPCPDLTQDLATTWTLADGTTWAYHADYCAMTDANDVWRGAGPFTLDAADGSTLTGELTSQAQLPTDGVPYSLQITGGTGRFDGASGSCAITIHLVELAFGVQQNTGTFSCLISASSAESAGPAGP